MVTQSSHFLIPHEEELSLDTSNGLGLVAVAGDPKIPLACASPTFLWIIARDPKDPTAAVLGQSKGSILSDTHPHLPHCLEHPHLG